MQQQYDHDHDGPKLKKDRQYNGESKKDKKKNNDLQNATGKHKHKKGGELRCSGRVRRPCSTSDTRSANFFLPFIDAKSHHCFIFSQETGSALISGQILCIIIKLVTTTVSVKSLDT